ncbi:aromatic amino acid transaminase [Sulfitobacter sp. 1A13496]|jgi:aspartate/tyrosine/aromatic aminotransferase|uniref:Aminotransferase class I/II-fold pyridoxal phosphate-dependent enzyme n=1 Tax=Thalassobius vesicularis TaxID=1294297 RepID=A0A4S3M863_9RHOB|nr:aromatic amino acid transaminase [Thalassobius vesicularis]THD73542.1 aminotransferase class I/II-fold pyridoxal phosphate-dependent enzyme [Thalassobius vesicularis]
MFEQVEDYPVDPIMIGADYFAADPRKDKLNLTVGIYQDEHGQTPVLEAVKLAEQKLVETQTSKSYLALTGDADYCGMLGHEIMGDAFDNGWVSAQTAGGAVALRVMADLLAQMPKPLTVWLQTPTYGNYIPILTAAHARFAQVPYYDRLKAQITFDQMLDGLKAAQAGDVFLMQGVCHNPTGADMTVEQFDALLDLLEARGIVPWIDLAYLGFAQSWDADCAMARKIAGRFPECIVCITLSKSFGIYRDRAGALFVKTRAGDRDRMHRALSAIVRSGASHAPDHGPSVVRTILQDDSIKRLWLDDLDRMRARVAGVRQQIVETERTLLGTNQLAYIGKQSGMFSLLPLTDAQETALTRDHGIHVVKGGRVNVARLGADDITKLIIAISDVTSAK